MFCTAYKTSSLLTTLMVLCTAPVHIFSCVIETDATSSVGIPTTDGRSERTYSCVNSDQYNCDYEIHVIGNYESSNGRHGFGIEREAGDTYVQLNVVGQSSKPLILVLTSYEPVNWQLSIPDHVVFNKVLLGGCYESTVTYSPGRVADVEVVDRDMLGYCYGSDLGGGNTDENLLYLTERFGPISSFSGSYRADSWVLNINRSSEPRPGLVCSLSATPYPTSLRLIWSAPLLPYGIITAYEVSYQPQGAMEPERVNTTGVSTTHTLTGLRPQTTYTLTVRAYTTAGSGEERSVTARTKAIPQIENVAVEVLNRTSVRLSWTPVSPLVPEATGYTVYYSPTACPCPAMNVAISGSETTTTVIVGLAQGEEYQFQVQAVVEVGGEVFQGDKSVAQRVTTGSVTEATEDIKDSECVSTGVLVGVIVAITILYTAVLVCAVVLMYVWIKKKSFSTLKDCHTAAVYTPSAEIPMKRCPAYGDIATNGSTLGGQREESHIYYEPRDIPN